MELLEKARVTRERELGVDHPDTLITLHGLAAAYKAAGETRRAIELYERVRNAQVKKLGPEHPHTLITLSHLATAYLAAGETKSAVELFERVRDAQVKKLGPEHPDTLTTLNNLAGAYQKAGEMKRAIELFERVRDARVKTIGPDHPDTLTTLNNLATAYLDAGETNRAIGLLEPVRDAFVKKLGPEHPATLASLGNLAGAYWSAKRLDKSIPLFEELLPRWEKKLGRDHPSTLTAVANLGVNYKDAGRLPEAIPLLEEAYRASSKHPALRWVGTPLLDGYLKAGKTAEAGKLLPGLRAQFPPASPQLAGWLAQTGRAFLQVDAFAEAEPLLRECLTIREKKEPDAWTTFNTRSMLGGALLGQKKYADAELLLLKGYEGLKAREKTIPEQGKVRIPEALDRLIELCTVLDRSDEVTKWQAERAKYPPAPLPVAPPPREKK